MIVYYTHGAVKRGNAVFAMDAETIGLVQTTEPLAPLEFDVLLLDGSHRKLPLSNFLYADEGVTARAERVSHTMMATEFLRTLNAVHRFLSDEEIAAQAKELARLMASSQPDAQAECPAVRDNVTNDPKTL